MPARLRRSTVKSLRGPVNGIWFSQLVPCQPRRSISGFRLLGLSNLQRKQNDAPFGTQSTPEAVVSSSCFHPIRQSPLNGLHILCYQTRILYHGGNVFDNSIGRARALQSLDKFPQNGQQNPSTHLIDHGSELHRPQHAVQPARLNI